ncbi:27842_t:CDS:1, partial [Racocetra persica]
TRTVETFTIFRDSENITSCNLIFSLNDQATISDGQFVDFFKDAHYASDM